MATIKETVSINAQADLVWPYVADPVLMSIWNDKIIGVDRPIDRPVSLGEKFDVTFRMHGTDCDSNVDVISCEDSRLVEFQHTIKWKNGQQIVVERYELDSRDGRTTTVTQSIDLSQALPWPFSTLIWLLSKFGKPPTPKASVMRQLKRVVEEDTNQTPN